MTYCDDRNRQVRILRALLVRETRWLSSDHDEDREEAVDALKWAISKLEGLPEHWVAATQVDAAGDAHGN